MTTAAKHINDKLVAEIEAAPNVPTMQQIWSKIQQIDSLNDLPRDRRPGSYTDGRIITTFAEDGSDHSFDRANFSFRTELVLDRVRELQRESVASEAADQEETPGRRGRPNIGGVVQVRLGDLIGPVDNYAAEHGVSRAGAIRQLVRAGLPGNDDGANLIEGLDRESYEDLLRQIHMYSREVAAFAVAEQPNGYEFGNVMNQRWQRICAALYHVAGFADASQVPEPFADETQGVRDLARADAEKIAARPYANWAN